MTVVQGGAFPHAHDALARRRCFPRVRASAASGARVGDAGVEVCAGVGEGDRRGGGASGVLEGVGQGLLDHAVDGELAARGEGARGRSVVQFQVDRQARSPYAVDEGGQFVERRLRCAVRVRVVVAQDAQEAAEFGQRLPAGRADGFEGLARALRALACRVGAAVRESCDDRQVVADDVVHLPGDPRAFGGGREFGLLVAFVLQPLCPLDQRLGVLAPGAYRDAQQDDEHQAPYVRDHFLAPAGGDAGAARQDRDDEQQGRRPDRAEGGAQDELEDRDQLEERRLHHGPRPDVDHGYRGQEHDHGQGVRAAPQQGKRESEAHQEDQVLGRRYVVVRGGPPAAGGVVEHRGDHPESGHRRVPDPGPAAVERAEAVQNAPDEPGEGGGRRVRVRGVCRGRGGGIRMRAYGVARPVTRRGACLVAHLVAHLVVLLVGQMSRRFSVSAAAATVVPAHRERAGRAGPGEEVTVPGRTVESRSWTAVRSPYRLVRPCAVIMRSTLRSRRGAVVGPGVGRGGGPVVPGYDGGAASAGLSLWRRWLSFAADRGEARWLSSWRTGARRGGPRGAPVRSGGWWRPV